MDYAFDLSMTQAAIWSNDAAALARDRRVREAARAALQRSLGGSPAHVLLAWLDCLADGGLPPCMAKTDAMTAVQRRWYDACGAALDASFQASGFNVHGLEPEEYGEMMELAWVSVAPATPAEFRGKAAWQAAFLARLGELNYARGAQALEELAEQEFDWHADQHPVCAADYLVGLTELSHANDRRARDGHPFYQSLRREAIAALQGHGFGSATMQSASRRGEAETTQSLTSWALPKRPEPASRHPLQAHP